MKAKWMQAVGTAAVITVASIPGTAGARGCGDGWAVAGAFLGGILFSQIAAPACEPVVVAQPQVVYPAPVIVSQPHVVYPPPVVVAQPQIVYPAPQVVYPAPQVVYPAPQVVCPRTTWYGGGVRVVYPEPRWCDGPPKIHEPPFYGPPHKGWPYDKARPFDKGWPHDDKGGPRDWGKDGGFKGKPDDRGMGDPRGKDKR